MIFLSIILNIFRDINRISYTSSQLNYIRIFLTFFLITILRLNFLFILIFQLNRIDFSHQIRIHLRICLKHNAMKIYFTFAPFQHSFLFNNWKFQLTFYHILIDFLIFLKIVKMLLLNFILVLDFQETVNIQSFIKCLPLIWMLRYFVFVDIQYLNELFYNLIIFFLWWRKFWKGLFNCVILFIFLWKNVHVYIIIL